jgi:hypothetical protein
MICHTLSNMNLYNNCNTTKEIISKLTTKNNLENLQSK